MLSRWNPPLAAEGSRLRLPGTTPDNTNAADFWSRFLGARWTVPGRRERRPSESGAILDSSVIANFAHFGSVCGSFEDEDDDEHEDESIVPTLTIFLPSRGSERTLVQTTAIHAF
jgi:hypothetical protein